MLTPGKGAAGMGKLNTTFSGGCRNVWRGGRAQVFSGSEHTGVPSLCPRAEVPRTQAPAGVFPLLVVASSLLCAGCCGRCSRPCNTRPASRLPRRRRPGASAGWEAALLSHPEPPQGPFAPFLEKPSDRVVSQVGNQGPREPALCGHCRRS